jgi:hypothetical protein
MPDYGFGRCDGHHEMFDFRLEKSSGLHASPARLTRDEKRKPRASGAFRYCRRQLFANALMAGLTSFVACEGTIPQSYSGAA